MEKLRQRIEKINYDYKDHDDPEIKAIRTLLQMMLMSGKLHELDLMCVELLPYALKLQVENQSGRN